MSNKRQSDDLQSSLSTILYISQFFGLFPVSGIKSKQLKFEWRSPAAIFSVFVLTSATTMSVFALLDILFGISEILEMTNFDFYFVCTVTVGAFLKLARRWPKFMEKWRVMENCMESYEPPIQLKSTLLKLFLTFYAFASVEHLICLATGIFLTPESSQQATTLETFNKYFESQFRFIYGFFSCPVWIGFILKIMATIHTFAWNFADVFIMLISIALAKRFEQLNIKIQVACTEKIKSSCFWSTTKEHYNILVRMCRLLDKELKTIIMISFGNNMSYILFQMYGCLRRRDHILEFVYFIYSFTWVLARLLFVCLYASKIHDESTKALDFMYPVQYKMDNEDLDLLVKQMQTTTVALSGRKMFYITRGLVFGLGGALLTYELFMYQYTTAKI